MIPLKYKAVSIGCLFFCVTVMQLLASSVVGAMIGAAGTDQRTIGLIMACNTAIPCLLAAGCFWMAGNPYAEFKEKIVKDKETVKQVVSEKLEDDWDNIR